MLEGELESELNFPRTGATVEETKTRCRALTEIPASTSVVKGQVRGLKSNVVNPVKEIEDFCPELHAVTFFDSPILVDREVNVLT